MYGYFPQQTISVNHKLVDLSAMISELVRILLVLLTEGTRNREGIQIPSASANFSSVHFSHPAPEMPLYSLPPGRYNKTKIYRKGAFLWKNLLSASSVWA